jgi:hypothetical protein
LIVDRTDDVVVAIPDSKVVVSCRLCRPLRSWLIAQAVDDDRDG